MGSPKDTSRSSALGHLIHVVHILQGVLSIFTSEANVESCVRKRSGRGQKPLIPGLRKPGSLCVVLQRLPMISFISSEVGVIKTATWEFGDSK